MKTCSKDNAITLIALVITIVVLLILAGVSIVAVVKEDGIIAQAVKSKVDTKISDIKEKVKLQLSEVQVNKSGEIAESDFNDVLNQFGTVKPDENGNDILETNDGIKIPVDEFADGKVIGVRNPDMFVFEPETGKILRIKDEYIQEKYIEDYNKYHAMPCELKNGINHLIIPNEINGVAVKSVENLGAYNVKKITFEDGIEYISCILRNYPKKAEPMLKEVILPNTLIEFNSLSALEGCYTLKSINLPESLKKLGSETFRDCTGLTEIYIPKNVETFGFRGLGYTPFFGCTNLEKIIVDPENKLLMSEDGILYSKDKTKIIKYPLAKKGDIFEVPNTVNTIGSDAFYGTKIKTLKIHKDVNSILNNPIAYSDIEEFIVDSNNEKYSSENGVLFNKTKTELISYPWKKKDITYNVPETVEKISLLLSVSYLETINIPAKTTIIENQFYDCWNLKNINIDPNNPKYLSENGILYNKDKTKLIRFAPNRDEVSLTIPGTVKSLSRNTFEACKNLKNVVIENGLTSMGEFAFWKAPGLETIVIPSSVTNIDSDTFYDCNNLKSITIDKPKDSVKYAPWRAPKGLEIIHWKE